MHGEPPAHPGDRDPVPVVRPKRWPGARAVRNRTSAPRLPGQARGPSPRRTARPRPPRDATGHASWRWRPRGRFRSAARAAGTSRRGRSREAAAELASKAGGGENGSTIHAGNGPGDSASRDGRRGGGQARGKADQKPAHGTAARCRRPHAGSRRSDVTHGERGARHIPPGHRDLGGRRAEPLADSDQLDVEGEAPGAQRQRAAARASGPEKNLNPHWVSVVFREEPGGPGTRNRGRAEPPDRASWPVLHHRAAQPRGTR